MFHFLMHARSVALALTALALGACGGTYYEEVHHHDDHSTLYAPELYAFHMIDSYNTHSEFDDDLPLAISPYVNLGFFDLMWEVYSDGDYFIDVRFNDRARVEGSQLIYSEFCGPGLDCEHHPYLYCDYDTNYTVSCENADGDTQGAYIGDYIHTLPQTGYWIVQVCDTSEFYCEAEIRSVIME